MGILKNYMHKNPNKEFVIHTIILDQAKSIAEDLQELGYKIAGYDMPVKDAMVKITEPFIIKYDPCWRYDACWLISRSGILYHPLVAYWEKEGYEILNFYYDYALKNEKYRSPEQSERECKKMYDLLIRCNETKLLSDLGWQGLTPSAVNENIRRVISKYNSFCSDESMLLGMN